MSPGRADFAVFGSSPLARLIASLLVHHHGKRAIIVGDSQAAFRLPRAIDLSIGPVTRPETWAVLADTVPETRKLLTRIGGKAGMARIDPILFAETPDGRDALAYIRNAAAGFGHAIERLGPSSLGADRDGFVLRDALHLHSAQLEPALDAWLDALKVARLRDGEVISTIAPDGSVRIAHDGNEMEAELAVLVDDAAVLAHVPAETIARIFGLRTGATILTEPTLPLIAPVMLQIDSGLCLSQTASGGVWAISNGDLDILGQTLGAMLASYRHVRRAGQSDHPMLASRDGAPVIGRFDGEGPLVVSNFGPIGAFLAPAIARFIAGDSQNDEAAYFAGRGPMRDLSPSMVAEYAPQLLHAETAA